MKRVKLAVVGAGHLGRIHAKLLAAMPAVELVAVVDPVASAREEVAGLYGAQPLADHRALLGQVDAAVIATPTKFHHQVALDFLRRGTPLLIEKPLAASVAEADELVVVARRHNALLQVGHVERFNPALRAATPHIGQPKFIEAVRASGFTFRSTDIGVVLDLMIHDLDVVLSLVGAPVVTASALGLAVLGRNEDVAHARLEFANGCVANLSASRVSRATIRRMQIWSDTGYAEVDFGNRAARVVRPGPWVLHRRLDVATVSRDAQEVLGREIPEQHLPLEELPVEPRNALADEQENFVRAVTGQGRIRVTGEDGRDALAVAERILESLRAHRWNGSAEGPTGPLAMPASSPLRGPHWHGAQAPLREAG